MRIKKIVLMLSLCLTAVLTAEAQNKTKEGNEIPWSVNRPLIWDDFKGSNAEANKSQAALVRTRISLDTKVSKDQDSVLVIIEALMVKNRSWKLRTTDSEYCLKHEQLHFDIAELFARKFRKQVSEMIPDKRTFNEKLSKMMKRIDKELSAMQNQYDKETNHSLIKEKQEVWNKKVAEDLGNYVSWAGSEIWVKF